MRNEKLENLLKESKKLVDDLLINDFRREFKELENEKPLGLCALMCRKIAYEFAIKKILNENKEVQGIHEEVEELARKEFSNCMIMEDLKNDK